MRFNQILTGLISFTVLCSAATADDSRTTRNLEIRQEQNIVGSEFDSQNPAARGAFGVAEKNTTAEVYWDRDKPEGPMSQPCPFTCNGEGYSHGGCKEWKDGDKCFIGPK